MSRYGYMLDMKYNISTITYVKVQESIYRQREIWTENTHAHTHRLLTQYFLLMPLVIYWSPSLASLMCMVIMGSLWAGGHVSLLLPAPYQRSHTKYLSPDLSRGDQTVSLCSARRASSLRLCLSARVNCPRTFCLRTKHKIGDIVIRLLLEISTEING